MFWKLKLLFFFQDKTIYVTGGGAYKFSDLISEKLNLTVQKVDEMSCICAGANFLLKNIADESFSYERQESPQYMFQSSYPTDLYPYLLVTIGSGVSVIKVTSETSFERIGKWFWNFGHSKFTLFIALNKKSELIVQKVESISGQQLHIFSN